MRLWHYKLIQFLPKSQLIAQWRELNSIFKKQDNHILINYIYEYPKEHLWNYTLIVIKEMMDRGIKINNWKNYDSYFANVKQQVLITHPFPRHHTDRYMVQCLYNLQEKFDRGQKDFTLNNYCAIYLYVKGYTKEAAILGKEVKSYE